MVALKSVFVILVISAVTSEAFLLGAIAGAATVPIIIGGKLILLPKILAIKAGIGMLGLKFAGIRYLREKVLIPASLAGAVAGYKATSTVMDAPHNLVETKVLAVEKMVHNLPKLPSLPIVPSTPSNTKKTFTLPSVPIPALQWTPKTVMMPNVVFTAPQSKTITITKQTVPAYAKPEPAQEEIIEHRY